MTNKRIGVYAGTFDPVHAGHVAFALQAVERAKLDELYFLPERRPRHKTGVEHFGHRVAMLRQAVQPYPKFDVLELDDVSFSIVRTLPKLRAKFYNDQLVFLFGSDAIADLPSWPQADQLLRQAELVIGCRRQDDLSNVESLIGSWKVQPRKHIIFNSYAPEVSSGRVRAALRDRQPVRGLLKSVERYSDRHWLYISLARASIDKP